MTFDSLNNLWVTEGGSSSYGNGYVLEFPSNTSGVPEFGISYPSALVMAAAIVSGIVAGMWTKRNYQNKL